MRRFVASIAAAAMFVGTPVAGQATRTDDPRGEQLYSTYCIGCHTTQVHWRDRKLATDWTSLKNQVRRWQGNIGLGLGEDDVSAIARHLNNRYYHFVPTDTTRSRDVDEPREIATQRHD